MNNIKFLKRIEELQRKMKAPKGRYSEFGKFSYRSLEDMLEEAKKHTEKLELIIVISDEIMTLGDRFYIESKASIYSTAEGEEGEEVYAKAYAREPQTKKGFDESQLTGTASSYARKYALSGLLSIDNGDDPDAHDNTKIGAQEAKQQGRPPAKTKPPAKKAEPERVKPTHINFMVDLITAIEDPGLEKRILAGYKVKDLSELTMEQGAGAMQKLQKLAEEKEAQRAK